MHIRIFENREVASAYAAALLEQTVIHQPHPVLGLATGETPLPLYRRLAEFHRQGLSFSHVTTFNLDEYVGLPATARESYHAFMEQHLFQFLDIPSSHRHIPNGLAADLLAECRRYDHLLQEHRIDLQLLGIGRNGHIGFNEPGETLSANTHVMSLSKSTRDANARFFETPDAVPQKAITIGLNAILESRHILLMAFGPDKADAIAGALSGEISTALPASLLETHPNVTWVLDREAARLLPESIGR